MSVKRSLKLVSSRTDLDVELDLNKYNLKARRRKYDRLHAAGVISLADYQLLENNDFQRNDATRALFLRGHSVD